MSGALIVAVVILAVAVTIFRRFAGEPLDARDLFALPIVLVAIGIYSLSQVDTWSTLDMLWVPLGCLVGLAFGALRGTTTVIFTKAGVLHQRYTGRTALVWLLSLLGGGAISLAGAVLGVHEEVRPVVLSIGVGLLGEMLTTGARALSTGQAFALRDTDTSSPVNRALGRLTTARTSQELVESPTFRDAVRRLLRA